MQHMTTGMVTHIDCAHTVNSETHDPHLWYVASDHVGTSRWCDGYPSLNERLRVLVKEEVAAVLPLRENWIQQQQEIALLREGGK